MIFNFGSFAYLLFPSRAKIFGILFQKFAKLSWTSKLKSGGLGEIRRKLFSLKCGENNFVEISKKFTENRAKILTVIKDVNDNLRQTDADLTDFIDKADDRVVASIDKIKSDEIQAFEDDAKSFNSQWGFAFNNGVIIIAK